jgi:hypothetical protein
MKRILPKKLLLLFGLLLDCGGQQFISLYELVGEENLQELFLS